MKRSGGDLSKERPPKEPKSTPSTHGAPETQQFSVLEGLLFVKLHDTKTVTFLDLSGNSLFSEDDIGLNRAQVCANRLGNLYQHVQFTLVTEELKHEHLLNCQMGEIEIFVCVSADDIETLKVKRSTTLLQLTRKILRLGFASTTELASPAEFYILFKGKNIHYGSFRRGLTLADMNINDQDHLIISRRGLFNVRVQIGVPSRSNQSHVIAVETIESLLELKMKIRSKIHIPKEEEQLCYCYNLMEDDDKSLASYGIFNPWVDQQDDPVIHLLPKDCTCLHIQAANSIVRYLSKASSAEGYSYSTIGVDVPTSIGTIVLSLKGNLKNTIGTLKSLIHEKVRSLDVDSPLAFVAEGPCVLLFNSKVVVDDSLTLKECGMKEIEFSPEKVDQNKLVLCPEGQFVVNVHLVLPEVPTEMQVLKVEVRCYDTVATLKTKINELVKISSNKEIMLIFEKRLLEDDRHCLMEYGIVRYPHTDGHPSYYVQKKGSYIIEALAYGPLDASVD